MPRSSGRGQTEPLAAIVAVVAICLGLSLYVGVLDASLSGSDDRAVARPALDRAERAVAPDGVAGPDRLDDARAAGPDGYRTNVTLSVGDRSWTAGPPSNGSVDVAATRVGVRTGPGAVRAGTLEVAVWS